MSFLEYHVIIQKMTYFELTIMVNFTIHDLVIFKPVDLKISCYYLKVLIRQ